MTEMEHGAVFVNCLLKNTKTEQILKELVAEFEVEILADSYIKYPEFNAEFHLYAVRKK
jgi:hypothetical protein